MIFPFNSQYKVLESYMDFIFPAADGFVRHDLCERRCQSLSEEPLTWLTSYVQTW